MGLIKSGKLPTAISPFSLRDVENEARAILARARHQAEQLLAAAQVEGERLKKESHALGLVEGRREGNAAGLEAGRTAGRNEALAAQNQALRQVLAALTASVAALEAQRGSLQAAGLVEIVKLSVAISRRVTKRQGLIEPEVLAANLSELMSFVAHAADIRIALHPTQNQTLQNVLPQLQVRWPNLKHVELVEDPSIAPQQGFVDADLDAQINRIVDDLLPRPAEASA
jgi:flagellar biosynthesis/type III secretory pathway protein FliH